MTCVNDINGNHRLQREPEFAKSHIFTQPLGSAAISVIIKAVEQRQAMGGVQVGIAFDALAAPSIGYPQQTPRSSTATVYSSPS